MFLCLIVILLPFNVSANNYSGGALSNEKMRSLEEDFRRIEQERMRKANTEGVATIDRINRELKEKENLDKRRFEIELKKIELERKKAEEHRKQVEDEILARELSRRAEEYRKNIELQEKKRAEENSKKFKTIITTILVCSCLFGAVIAYLVYRNKSKKDGSLIEQAKLLGWELVNIKGEGSQEKYIYRKRDVFCSLIPKVGVIQYNDSIYKDFRDVERILKLENNKQEEVKDINQNSLLLSKKEGKGDACSNETVKENSRYAYILSSWTLIQVLIAIILCFIFRDDDLYAAITFFAIVLFIIRLLFWSKDVRILQKAGYTVSKWRYIGIMSNFLYLCWRGGLTGDGKYICICAFLNISLFTVFICFK